MANYLKKDRYSSMDSEYHFSTDFSQKAGSIGATASPQTPNQIGELTSRLNQGLKAVELGTMNQRLLDQVPLEHFKEVRRLNTLTGSKASIHAPIQDLDLAGFTQQGQDEFERKVNVEKLKSVMDRAHLMDDSGNVPITIHAGSFPAQKWQKEGLFEGGEIEEGQKPLLDQRSEMAIINQDTGQMQLVRYKEKEYVSGKKVIWSPEYGMNNLNRTSWDEEKLKLMQWKKEMNEVEDRFEINRRKMEELDMANKKKLLTSNEKAELMRLKSEEQNIERYKSELYTHMRSLSEDMYNRFKEYSPNDVPSEVKNEFKKNVSFINQTEEEIEKTYNKLNKEKDLEKKDELLKKFRDLQFAQSEAVAHSVEILPAPKTWISAEDFAKEKVSDSLAEAASYGYKKYGEKAPLISVENVYPEFALSRADSLKATVEETRKKFAEKLVKDKKLSEKKAKEVAEKLIGATWDVGHIYMLRKYGYTDEDIRKETEKIGKLVKHIHLTDNFGFEDAHLPPGEGVANIKEQLEEIRKSLGEKEYQKRRAIVEAGEFVANFKEAPHLYALSDLNSPLYAERLEPYWRDIWETHGTYFGGFGEMMPQKYFDLYGAPGFSQLPTALGGQAGASPDRGRLATSKEEET